MVVLTNMYINSIEKLLTARKAFASYTEIVRNAVLIKPLFWLCSFFARPPAP